jgi:MFS family permease
MMGEEVPTKMPVPLWQNRDYMLLWFGQAISSLGTGITLFAFPLLILAFTHSFAVAGFSGALGELPFLLFVLPAGVVVDRWNRKRIMIVCSVGLTLFVASIPIAIMLGHLTVIQLYIVSFLIGTLTVFYQLAQLAALTYVVPKQQLSTAVAQDEVVYGSVSLLAPSIGGFLLNMSNVFPFLADTVSYLLLIVSLFGIRASFQAPRSPRATNVFAEVREGFSWLWSHIVVRFLAFLTGYLYVVMAGSILIVYAIARQHHISPLFIGVILAVGGGGNLLGTVIAPLVQRRIRFGWSLFFNMALFILLWPLYNFANAIISLAIVVAAIALLDSISSIIVSSYRLAIIPDELQGRVGSVYRLILYGSFTLGQVLVGLCLQSFGATATIAALWSGLILFTLMIIAFPGLRRASYPQEAPKASLNEPIST